MNGICHWCEALYCFPSRISNEYDSKCRNAPEYSTLCVNSDRKKCEQRRQTPCMISNWTSTHKLNLQLYLFGGHIYDTINSTNTTICMGYGTHVNENHIYICLWFDAKTEMNVNEECVGRLHTPLTTQTHSPTTHTLARTQTPIFHHMSWRLHLEIDRLLCQLCVSVIGAPERARRPKKELQEWTLQGVQKDQRCCRSNIRSMAEARICTRGLCQSSRSNDRIGPTDNSNGLHIVDVMWNIFTVRCAIALRKVGFWLTQTRARLCCWWAYTVQSPNQEYSSALLMYAPSTVYRDCRCQRCICVIWHISDKCRMEWPR